MQIFLLHIDHYLDKDVILQKMKTWPINIQEQVNAFQQQKDYNATFFGKVLLMYAFRQLHLQWDWNLLDHTEKGKPFLKESNIHFNISHSGDYVLLGISDKVIGVDIEKHRPVRIELFNRQFQEEEWREIHAARKPLDKFFQFWSIKEAAIKADGRGVEILSRTKILTDHIIHIDEATWNYQFFSDLDGYSIAICSESTFCYTDKDIETINMDMLLQ